METLLKQSQSNVKLNNLRLILNTIIKKEPLSRADLVRVTHISKPTVSSLVDELIKRNLVIEIGEGESSKGRKPTLLKFNSTLKYFLVFDMGREDYHVAISDLKGNIIGKRNGVFEKLQNYRERLNVLNEIILDLMDKNRISKKSLLKVNGIAPGVYVEKGKELKWFSGNENNEYYDIRKFFEDELLTTIMVNHSTKLSLLGEKTLGKARGFKNVVYIDFAYGLGCSLMIDGNIYFGPNYSAGEIGYFYSDLNEFKNYKIVPYDFGALEKIISGRALQQKGIECVMKYKNKKLLELTAGDTSKITGRTMFQAAMEGDPHVYSVLRESFNYFNMALCNIINIFNPELVVFGGGFSKSGDLLMEFIVNEIEDKVLIMPKLEISELKDEASIIGAIAYLIEHTDFLSEL